MTWSCRISSCLGANDKWPQIFQNQPGIPYFYEVKNRVLFEQQKTRLEEYPKGGRFDSCVFLMSRHNLNTALFIIAYLCYNHCGVLPIQ